MLNLISEIIIIDTISIILHAKLIIHFDKNNFCYTFNTAILINWWLNYLFGEKTLAVTIEKQVGKKHEQFF